MPDKKNTGHVELVGPKPGEFIIYVQEGRLVPGHTLSFADPGTNVQAQVHVLEILRAREPVAEVSSGYCLIQVAHATVLPVERTELTWG